MLYSARFSPDGKRIVSASLDKIVRIWNSDGHGKPVLLRGHEGTVRTAVFSPDGKRIVSASQDATVRVWSDLKSIELDDPRLWSRSNYYLPIERR